ncbi:hypothetical protein [Parasphingopyxis sp.]|uniref:hypothetical protein n=1 Tax=Parasphingopyxis sp. TaxID=1920299 RepID=UPI00260D96D3|nr:hypothetical protein [Parasphingopyxis sp.]
MTDKTLDSALAKSRDPMVPAGLAQRVAAEAMAQPQRSIEGPFQARRTRRPARKRRARRPIVLGAIGGGLMAASAVAAALVSDGTFELARITKPVVELFVPEAPRETVEAPATPAAPPVRAAADAEMDAPLAERAVVAQRPGWRIRQVRRAMIVRQRLERLRQARAEGTVSPEQGLPRRTVAPVRALSPEQRARVRQRIESLTPEQRQRLREVRERRMAAPPAVRERIIERRRDRIGERLRDRGLDAPVQRPGSATPDTPDRPAATQPSRTAPAASEAPAASNARRSMTIENTPPGPEAAPLDQIRPELPAADMPAATSARRDAIQQRIRAARAAERARAAQRRNGAQRPARPRVPPRRR